MSSASDRPTARLGALAADQATELFVVDGGMRLRARDRGTLWAELPPGVYTVRAMAGGRTEDRMVVLRPGGLESVAFGPVPFSSPAPLEGTATTHEYHADFAERQSRVVHGAAGTGSWVFVMARAWRPAGRPAGPRDNPAAGVTLQTPDGATVFDFGAAASETYPDVPDMDPCGGGTVAVDPGHYVLVRPGPGGETRAQTVTALPDWQTEVFLLRPPADAARAIPSAAATVLMSDGWRGQRGFNPGNPDLRLGDLARLGLVNDRQVFGDGLIHEILEGKFRDPMLGLLGAHLLLRTMRDRPDAERAEQLERMQFAIVPNLRRLFGPAHPDVEALAIAVGLPPAGRAFGVPPMLRRSWAVVVDATAGQPDLVPGGSLAETVADRLLTDEPWLAWSPPVPHAKGADLEAVPARPGPVEELVAALLRPAGRPVSKDATPPAVPDEQQIRRLVRTLGLPRGRVEALVKSHRSASAGPATGPAPRSPDAAAAPAPVRAGEFARGHALVIGIDEYTGPGIDPLPATVRTDAADLAGLLRDPGRCGYPESNVRTLFGRSATRTAILSELDRLRTVTDPDSTVVLYFSGHGARLADGEYLLPADADGSSPRRLTETAISAAEFSDRVRQIPTGQLLAVLDCCHAAGVAALTGAGATPGLGGDLYERLYAGGGRAVLAACAPDEKAVVLRDTDRNSLFTTHLLDGLRGKAAADDGLVKVFGLFEYAQLRVTAAFPKQHPVFKADLRRNFPVARNNAGEAGVVAREPAAAYRYDAYVAHADEDFDWVANRLIPALTKDGLRHTVSGDALGQFRVVAVQEAVKKSKYVLLVISPHFTADRAARLAGILGLDQGLQQGIGKVIPVKIGEPTADVGLAVEALVGVDLTRPARRGEAEMARLLRQLHEDPQTW